MLLLRYTIEIVTSQSDITRIDHYNKYEIHLNCLHRNIHGGRRVYKPMFDTSELSEIQNVHHTFTHSGNL